MCHVDLLHKHILLHVVPQGVSEIMLQEVTRQERQVECIQRHPEESPNEQKDPYSILIGVDSLEGERGEGGEEPLRLPIYFHCTCTLYVCIHLYMYIFICACMPMSGKAFSPSTP